MENISAKSSWKESFEVKLRRHLRFKIDLVINENRTVMLNMLGRRRLSMHRMFLDAPESVIEAIAHYVRGKRHRGSEHLLRSYIQSYLPTLDYSSRVNPKRLKQVGEVYNLKEIYTEINHTYFGGEMEVEITWFGRVVKKRRSRITFGEYHDSLKLIKIHRILDDLMFPSYFVSFVVYHEMLHHVVPCKRDPRGFTRIHTAEFKAKERLFADYRRAVAWEKENKEKIFGWA